MDPAATPVRLRPGLRLVRRDPHRLQLGIDPPGVAVLPDHPDVRALVEGLALGVLPARPSPVASAALETIRAAGLLVPDDALERRARAERMTVRVQRCGHEDFSPALGPLLATYGVAAATSSGRSDVVVVAAAGEVDRAHLDALMQGGVTHLVVRDFGDRLVIGPFVVPGHTACLRCCDAHASTLDPRRGLVLAQVATTPPMALPTPDPAVRAVAVGAVVRDLVTYAEGGRPATWSATLEITPDLSFAPQAWLRHPGCGCAWGDALAS